jgi:hypothetical protein
MCHVAYVTNVFRRVIGVRRGEGLERNEQGQIRIENAARFVIKKQPFVLTRKRMTRIGFEPQRDASMRTEHVLQQGHADAFRTVSPLVAPDSFLRWPDASVRSLVASIRLEPLEGDTRSKYQQFRSNLPPGLFGSITCIRSFRKGRIQPAQAEVPETECPAT